MDSSGQQWAPFSAMEAKASAVEAVKALRIGDQNPALRRRVRREQRDQIDQIAVVGHVFGYVRVWPVGAPQNPVRCGFDKGPCEGQCIREWRPRVRDALCTADLDPALAVIPRKIEEASKGRLCEACF